MNFVQRSLVCGLFIAALLRGVAPAQEVPPVATIAELQKRLADHISNPKFTAATWGVKIVSLDSGEIIFEHNPHKLFSPASNSKLYTVALALDRLGPDYRIRTSLYADSKPNKWSTLKSDLILFGRGDPTINARVRGGNIFAALDPLVAALTNAGVKRIAGDLVADESYFRGPPFGSGWVWDDMQYYYGAELSALTIADNTLQVSVKPGPHSGAPCKLEVSPPTSYLTFSNRTETIGKDARRSIRFHRPLGQNVVYVSGQMPAGDAGYTEDVTMHNPAGLFADLFKEALARHGIHITGKVRTVNWLARQADPVDYGDLIELGFLESLPMRDLAREVQKPSQNLYTDLLLAHVGEKARGDGSFTPNSEDLGIRELNKFLDEAGVRKGDVLFEEGSGLSRNNLTTPNATIALLQFMQRHPCAEPFLEALPIAGVDGTLRTRMKGTPAEDNVRAKTGTLRWANSLSGHLTSAAGERFVFSIMLNRYHNTDPDRSARTEIDTVAVLLASFAGRTVK
jgi:serine-type D-Ala-D-Ala carboxypeptidase/endopeptidase (penicillin-binding protein 4)